MAETAGEYVSRILGYLEGADPINVLSETPARLREMTAGLSSQQMRHSSDPDKWSISDMVSHLVDVEMVIGYRIRQIVASDGISIQLFDQDRWIETGRNKDIDGKRLVEMYEAFRDFNLAFVKSLTPDQLECAGLHEERGRETVSQIISLNAGHDLNHLKQIAAAVAALRPN